MNLDNSSALRKLLVERYQERLQKLRIKNDLTLSDIDTATLRGRIKEIKEFLSFLHNDEKERWDQTGPIKLNDVLKTDS